MTTHAFAMSSMTPTPTWDEFRVTPVEHIAHLVPATVIYNTAGTRRQAALAGVAPHSDDYVFWSRQRMITCFELLFRFGVHNLFSCLVRSNQFAEVGYYRERLIDWIDWWIAGPEALTDYHQRGWRVRLVGVDDVPELHSAVERLHAATPDQWHQTVWFSVNADLYAQWKAIIATAKLVQVGTQAEAIRALYGEDIPPAQLFISFGKPMVAPDVLPLLLADELHCYWTQQPGYSLDEITLRRIVYDYVYLRHTWTPDKSSRYNDIHTHRHIWEQPRVLGLGQRIGDFWYPTSG